MISGYVLLDIKNSYEHKVAEKLSMIDEITDIEPLIVEETALADPFFEEYNLMIKIKANDRITLKRIVEKNIHSIEGVEKTRIVSRTKV